MYENAVANWRLIATVGIAVFSGLFGVFLVPFQVGALIDGLGLTSSQSGGLGALEIAAMSLTAIVIGPKLNQWRCSSVAMTGALIAAVCELSSAVTVNFYLLSALRFFVGVGCGCLFGAAVAACAASDEPDSNFGWAQGLMNLLYVGLFLAMPIALGFDQHRGLFLLLGLLLLIALPITRHLPSPRVAGAQTPGSRRQTNVRLVVIYITATILFNLSMGALWGFVERIGVKEIGLTIESVASILSIGAIFTIFGSVLAGVIGSRFGRGLPIVIAIAMCALSVATITYSQQLETFAVGVFVYDAAYLFIGPYIITGLASALDETGRLAAIIGGIVFLAYSVGIAVGGFIVDALSVNAIGWLAIVNCLIAAPLYYLVDKEAVPPESTVTTPRQ